MLSKTVNAISRSTAGLFKGVDASSVERVRGLSAHEALDLVRFARRRLREEMLPQVAGSLTFTTTLALVPLLTIVLAIFTTFPIFGQLRTALETYFAQALIPKAISSTIISNLTQFASKAKGLSLLGAIVLLFTTTTMMGMIERVFNRIWRVRRPRPLTQRVLVYWALITLGPLLFGLSITLTAQLFTATDGITRAAPMVGAFFSMLASVALTTGAYTLLYVTVPNRRVGWRDALCGALAAALAFELAKRLFALFIRQFPTYAIIYGALAALPLFLVWMYLSWLITLVGAVLAAALPIVKYERWWHVPAPGGEFIDAMAVLKVLHGGAHATGSALVTSSALRAHTRIGYDELSLLLEQMVGAGWVGRVQVEASSQGIWRATARSGQDAWVLLADPEKLRVAEVYRLFVFGGAEAALSPAARPVAGSNLSLDTAALARQVETAVEEGLEEPIAAYFARA
ncbi:YihY family inner membrane protein [Massilia sp. Se16.2.3]|uniref:YihY family inner membrane protein n=1 Tax=Massilia sp. Se16.2.3 TaxID=2709303 RepID=UPI0016014234|nr:YihY family inner membrane protein [Massilia sp. Se16.2.3]QNA99848.1 YihY family inner membrane protein [Massilia sp. Se16.2.3]